MRPILALAILLVGLKGAAPESKYQDSVLAAGGDSLSLVSESAPSGRDANREFNLAIPLLESSDAAHDQDEEAAEPPQSPGPASTDADADADVAESLDDLCNALLTSAQDNDLPVPFFANLIWQESRLRHDAVSKVGALGIAQFMPEVAVEAGLADPFDPRQAIPASARFLHALRAHFGNLGFVAAAYNAGAHRVGQWLDHQRALPQETRTYVLRVTGRSAEAWRKSPLNDSRLTFVSRLPCRGLPAFADLEQAQLRDAQQTADAQQPQPRPQQPKTAHKGRQKFASKAAPKVTRSATAGIMARNFRAKHDATRPQRVLHEKRRIAEATFAMRATAAS
jgi:hypothetical protein